MTLNKAILRAFDYIQEHNNVNLVDKIELWCVFDKQKTQRISIQASEEAENYFSVALQSGEPRKLITVVMTKPVSIEMLLSDGWKVRIHESQTIDLGV